MAAEQLPSAAPDILANSGWLATGVLAVIGWISRVAMGRHFKSLDKLAEKVEEMGTSIAKVDTRLARIEGRFEEKDHDR